jgi:ADP-ribose pyrophosphatase YjhB (NUDIX family)
MESQWLALVKRVQALAVTGQQFTQCPFDLERYQELEGIAHTLLSMLGAVPLEQVQGLFASNETGYVTPKVEVRGAVIRAGKVLLVQEKEDGLWAMPGGYADVGLSAAANVEKEVWEEAGLRVSARYLYALRHKASAPYPPDARDFYKLHFICADDGVSAPSAGVETHQARFFAPDQLPPLSPGKNLPDDISAAFDYAAIAPAPTRFD